MREICLLNELKVRDICIEYLKQINIDKKQEDNLDTLLSVKEILEYYFT